MNPSRQHQQRNLIFQSQDLPYQSLWKCREKRVRGRQPRALTLRITSSDSRFAPVERMLLDEPAPPPSGSSSAFFVDRIPTFYPNQYDPNQKGGKWTLLNRMSWSFMPKDKPRFNLIFEFRLKSNGTQVVPANYWRRVRNASNVKGLKYIRAKAATKSFPDLQAVDLRDTQSYPSVR